MNLSPKPSSEPGPASPTPIPRGHRWLLLILGVLLPLYGFGCLAEALRNRGGLGWDTSALTFVHKHDSPELDRILILITQTGDLRLVLIVTVVCAAVLLLARRKRDERFLAHSVVGAAVIILAVKAAFHRLPPRLFESGIMQLDLGSPSAHAMGTSALALGLAVGAWGTRWRWLTILLVTLCAFLVALSRVYLGVHQASDVLAAWILAEAWVVAIWLVRDIAEAKLARRRKCLLFVSGLLASLVAVLAGYISSDLAHNNLRTVAPGQAYRSGQMSTNALARCIRTYGIKSILNLRGKNASHRWYIGETEMAQALNVAHYDFGISSGQELRVEDVDKIAQLLRDAPKPVLIHCIGGADRSGLASAIYLYTFIGETPEEAGRELSMWNGHMPLLRPSVSAMDHSFSRYVSNRVSHTEAKTVTGD
jgi:membrane-associated phospholipid phosphatase/protein tyrosine/serine phosphatase